MKKSDQYRLLTHFQHWLGTKFSDLPTCSEEMTKRAIKYLSQFPNAFDFKLVSPLSPKLQECLSYIEQFERKYNKSPSVRNVAKGLGISSTAAHYRIQKVKSTPKRK